MNSSNSSDPNTRSEIMAGMVLGDMSDDEHALLSEGLSNKEILELLELERTAAALRVGMNSGTSESIPESLQQTILEKGIKIVGNAAHPDTVYVPPVSTVSPGESSQVPRQSNRVLLRESIAWLACAASIAIAIGIWSNDRTGLIPSNGSPFSRDKLIARAPDLIRVSWADGKTPLKNKVSGDVVWSNEYQQGFMRFVDMPVNDPTLEQYQLWIIDPTRDDEPIDGGVFDISDSKESIIAIQAKLRVDAPKAFAVTVEKPGGVVVSTQERLPLLAVIDRQ